MTLPSTRLPRKRPALLPAIALVCATLLLGGSAGSAKATGAASITLSRGSGGAGSPLTMRGSGFPAATPVQFTWGGQTVPVPHTETAKDGTFSVDFVVPYGFGPGSYPVRATAGTAAAQATFGVLAGQSDRLRMVPQAAGGVPVRPLDLRPVTPRGRRSGPPPRPSTVSGAETSVIPAGQATTPLSYAAAAGHAPQTAAVAASGGAAPSGVYLGVVAPGAPWDWSSLWQYMQDSRRPPAIVSFWRDMDWRSGGYLDTNWLRQLANGGSVAMITWEPMSWTSADQSPYSLSNISNGGLDSFIWGWANTLRDFGGPVLIRWGHEMNGWWFPNWSGNPSAYVAAWRHIHDIFTWAGASNVQWVWAPNYWYPGDSTGNALSYYPGDAYVDWVGIDGYNWAPQEWTSFTTVFSTSYNALTAATSKPIMLAEFASGEPPSWQGNKGQWITDALSNALPHSFPRIRAIVWFNQDMTASDGCCNWPIESSWDAQSAYANAISSPYYLDSWWP